MIYKDNRNKCEIYRWNILISGKSYIGSSINSCSCVNKHKVDLVIITLCAINKSVILKKESK